MKIRIYQIDPERDFDSALFQGSKVLERMFGDFYVDLDIYDEVYCGEVKAKDLEDVYREFRGGKNLPRPMTVSDIVEVQDSGNEYIPDGKYFCDNVGFRPVVTKQELEQKLKVVICEPNKEARIAEIDSRLEAMQETVGGYIEVYCPFEDDALIVCNEEGKINGMEPCRAVYDKNGNLMDVVFGTFFICKGHGENMDSLSDEQLKKYEELFRSPEKLVKDNDEYKMVKTA